MIIAVKRIIGSSSIWVAGPSPALKTRHPRRGGRIKNLNELWFFSRGWDSSLFLDETSQRPVMTLMALSQLKRSRRRPKPTFPSLPYPSLPFPFLSFPSLPFRNSKDLDDGQNWRLKRADGRPNPKPICTISLESRPETLKRSYHSICPDHQNALIQISIIWIGSTLCRFPVETQRFPGDSALISLDETQKGPKPAQSKTDPQCRFGNRSRFHSQTSRG